MNHRLEPCHISAKALTAHNQFYSASRVPFYELLPRLLSACVLTILTKLPHLGRIFATHFSLTFLCVEF